MFLTDLKVFWYQWSVYLVLDMVRLCSN